MIPGLTEVVLGGDLAEAMEALPAAAGVGQIRATGGRSLVIGRPANLRRWAASHLGQARPRKKGGRPPLDLRPVAASIAFVETTSPFHQRLLFERLMGRTVAPSARRDLKPAAFLRLDLDARFPRIAVHVGLEGAPLGALHGPFRDRAAADRARQALDRLHRLRPCDYVFEPDPSLPLGLGCVYAQVGSCAAPCLARVDEAEYRSLAARAAASLSPGAQRHPDLDGLVRPWTARADAFGLVAEPGSRGLELYPVRSGAVWEEGSARRREAEPLEDALERVDWRTGQEARDDSAWLSAWLHARRRGGAYVAVEGVPAAASLAERLRASGLGSA